MSRIKADIKPVKRAALNTTIEEDILVEFKAKCKELGLPMNLLVSSFMQQFNDGIFVLRVGKNNKIEIDEKE